LSQRVAPEVLKRLAVSSSAIAALAVRSGFRTSQTPKTRRLFHRTLPYCGVSARTEEDIFSNKTTLIGLGFEIHHSTLAGQGSAVLDFGDPQYHSYFV
jgi:hypothetical protein